MLMADCTPYPVFQDGCRKDRAQVAPDEAYDEHRHVHLIIRFSEGLLACIRDLSKP